MKFTNSKTARMIENETPYISFPILEQFPFIKHGFSTRLGGVSQGIYESMNLSFGRGDDPCNVIQNFERISHSIGVDAKSLVLSDQVHKTHLRKVTKEDCGKGITSKRDYSEIDGLYTDEDSVTLVTSYADCVPLLFVDPIKKAIAASHAGWRGTVGKIGPKTIETMQKEYNSDPKDIVVVIGPSICQDCYEVSSDVANQFNQVIEEEKRHEIVTRQDQYKQKQETGSKDKYQLNLWEANKYFLMQAGVLEENIEIANVCTCCNSDIFHSHRASKGMRGGLCAFIALDKEK